MALLLLLACGVLAGAEAPPSPAVAPPAELAKAPWYDPQGDTWRRVVPKPPPERSEQDAADGEGGDGAVPFFAFAMYALVALAIGLLVAQLWRLRGGWGELDAAPRPVGPPASVSALPFALPRDDQDPETALRAALAAGDLALAVVWLYALQLLRLDDAGVIRLAAGRTNRVYLREAAVAAPGAAPALQATVAVFERSHFGHQPPTRAELEDLLARHRALLAALPAPAVAR